MTTCIPDLLAANRLFTAHRPFAARLAMHRARCDPRARFDEYESAAMLGLWLACLRFNAAATVPFTGFAYRYVLGTIMKYQHDEYGRGEKRRDHRRRLEHLNDSHLARVPRDDVADRDEVEAVLARLPERTRQVLRDYYLRGLTMRECGARIGVQTSRVSQIISAVSKGTS